MLSFKKKISKQVETIHDTISNDEERQKVMLVLQEMIKDFTTKLVQINERVESMENNVGEIYDVMSRIDSAINDFNAEEDGYAVCPYCGEDVPVLHEPEDGDEIECPSCHNIIEVHVEPLPNQEQPLDANIENNIVSISEYKNLKAHKNGHGTKNNKTENKNDSKNDK